MSVFPLIMFVVLVLIPFDIETILLLYFYEIASLQTELRHNNPKCKNETRIWLLTLRVRVGRSADTVFYDAPRFVTHIDDPAIRALTKYYSTALPASNTPGVAVLDMCSSWISHYPKGYKQERIVGLGLNEAELKKNEVLTEYVVQDLNVNPSLPFADNSFDVITNVVSVDYLTKPLEIFKEMQRVLKPGGLAAMSFSNRCFFTKAISIWTSTGDVDHVMIVGSYFHYTGGFEPPQALDISPNPGRTDPMYIVYSKKLKSEGTSSA